MACLAMIKSYVEGNDLVNELNSDMQTIQGGDVPAIEQAWEDMTFNMSHNPEFTDIFNNKYASANGVVQNAQTQAENYMQSVQAEVERPNWNPSSGDSQYIPLYVGSSSVQSDGEDDYINENFNGTATLWSLINSPSENLATEEDDCYYDNPAGPGQGLGCDWSMSGQINLGTNVWDESQTDNGRYCSAQASATAWAPFIHLEGGSSSALAHNCFLTTPA